MRQLKLVTTVLMSSVLVACGGGGSDVPAKPKFTSQVLFGDSLSDVGSYKVGVVAGLGGGQFTINGAAGVPTNWTQMTAKSLGLPAPCAAQTGLDNGSGVAPGTPAGTVITVVNSATCTGYAQGGSRITNLVGVGNRFVPVAAGTPKGFALTVPVVTQIGNHLAAHGGSFTGSEVVTVMAGANDVFVQAGMVSAGALTPASAVAAVQTAATELAAAVNTQIIAKGAKYVVLVNIPDISSTPQVTSLPAAAIPTTKGLFDMLVNTFNATLKAGVPDSAVVLNVDANTASRDEVANPAKYNLTNVAATACNLAAPSNPLASSLACNAGNLAVGVTPATHYLFADKVHPTPYGHLLFATYVLQAMTNKGWY
ncbi:MAG: SGNH/GDSL hydrolase family protein [Gallionella sp.]